jgi:protein SCO1/2
VIVKIYDLANKGFNLYAGENKVNGGFEHSGLFALIDKNGDIRCRKMILEIYSLL